MVYFDDLLSSVARTLTLNPKPASIKCPLLRHTREDSSLHLTQAQLAVILANTTTGFRLGAIRTPALRR